MRPRLAPADVETPAPVTVVGDTHLSPWEPEPPRRFLEFLKALEGKGGTLVLLGDLFETWFGDEQAERPFESAILQGLRRVADSGVKVAFVAGNRDFAMSPVPGLAMEFWPDLVRTRWGDRTVLLTHGDLLCSADRAYLRMRRFLRSPFAVFGRGVLPTPVRSYLAYGLRAHSERSGRRSRGAMAGIDYGEAAEWLERHQADVLVAGHVHTGVHHRLPGEKPRDVYVLKDWHRVGGIVTFDGRQIALTTP